MIHGKAAFLIRDETDETTLPFRIAEGRTHHEILSNEINALKLTRKVKIFTNRHTAKYECELLVIFVHEIYVTIGTETYTNTFVHKQKC